MRSYLKYAVLVFSITLILIAVFPGITGIIGLIIIGFIMGFKDPIVSGYLHHRISSDKRATIDSFQSLAENIISILIGLVFGWVSAEISIFNAYGTLGIACCIYFIIFLIAVKKIKT